MSVRRPATSGSPARVVIGSAGDQARPKNAEQTRLRWACNRVKVIGPEFWNLEHGTLADSKAAPHPLGHRGIRGAIPACRAVIRSDNGPQSIHRQRTARVGKPLMGFRVHW